MSYFKQALIALDRLGRLRSPTILSLSKESKKYGKLRKVKRGLQTNRKLMI